MYLNLKVLENKLDVFNIILGNRGGGKTYTCLRDCIQDGKSLSICGEHKKKYSESQRKSRCEFIPFRTA